MTADQNCCRRACRDGLAAAFQQTVAEVTWANIQKVACDLERAIRRGQSAPKELGSRNRAFGLTPARDAGAGRTRRRLRRHRRHLLELADSDAALSRENTRLPGHWANAIAMATTIAHKGTQPGQGPARTCSIYSAGSRREGLGLFPHRPDKGSEIRSLCARQESPRSSLQEGNGASAQMRKSYYARPATRPIRAVGIA